MPRGLNLIVTCTDRKRERPNRSLEASQLPKGSTEDRSKEWIRRMRTFSGEGRPAIDLYTGSQWHVIRGIIDDAQRQTIRLRVWILSAGYGLIPTTARISPYSASFASGPDRVVDPAESKAWWSSLAEWEGPDPDGPRSLTELATRNRNDLMLVVASAPYIRAVLSDLRAAAGILSPSRLAIISTGLRNSPSLEGLVVPSDDRFLQKFGGTLHSLNAKLAGWALSCFDEWSDDISKLHSLFATSLEALEHRERPTRTPQTDHQVMTFIRGEFLTGKRSYSGMLKAFRTAGLACEQKRFKDLYLSIARKTAT